MSRPEGSRRCALLAAGFAALFVAGCGGTTTTITVTNAVAPVTDAIAAKASPSPGGTTAPAPTTGAPTPPSPTVLAAPRPRISWAPIPFGPERKAQMVEYTRRHYSSFLAPNYKLVDPHVIVIHFTETPTFQSTFNTFAPDTPDPELHELPNTCAHFVIDKSGGIHQLVPLGIMCRHTVGLNWLS